MNSKNLKTNNNSKNLKKKTNNNSNNENKSVNYYLMTKNELKELINNNDIKGYSNKNKNELIELLMNKDRKILLRNKYSKINNDNIDDMLDIAKKIKSNDRYNNNTLQKLHIDPNYINEEKFDFLKSLYNDQRNKLLNKTYRVNEIKNKIINFGNCKDYIGKNLILDNNFNFKREIKKLDKQFFKNLYLVSTGNLYESHIYYESYNYNNNNSNEIENIKFNTFFRGDRISNIHPKFLKKYITFVPKLNTTSCSKKDYENKELCNEYYAKCRKLNGGKLWTLLDDIKLDEKQNNNIIDTITTYQIQNYNSRLAHSITTLLNSDGQILHCKRKDNKIHRFNEYLKLFKYSSNLNLSSVLVENKDFISINHNDVYFIGQKKDGSILCYLNDGVYKKNIIQNPMEVIVNNTNNLHLRNLSLKEAKDIKFTATACTQNHNCFALDNKGKIYLFGDFPRGKRTLVNFPSPNDNKDFYALSCGTEHLMALKKNGSIYQCGHELAMENFPSPNENKDFVAILAQGFSCMGIKKNGEIVNWGYDNRPRDLPKSYLPNKDFVLCRTSTGNNVHTEHDQVTGIKEIKNENGSKSNMPVYEDMEKKDKIQVVDIYPDASPNNIFGLKEDGKLLHRIHSLTNRKNRNTYMREYNKANESSLFCKIDCAKYSLRTIHPYSISAIMLFKEKK